MAMASWPGSRSAELPIGANGRSGALDRDDRQVGEGVDAVDGAGELTTVVEDDHDVVGVLDDVPVGEDEAVLARR